MSLGEVLRMNKKETNKALENRNLKRIDKIKQIIIQKKMTQKQFAECIGVTEQHLCRLLKGKFPVKETFLISINKAFPEYSMYELGCFEDEADLSDGICINAYCVMNRHGWSNGCVMLNSIKSCKAKVTKDNE